MSTQAGDVLALFFDEAFEGLLVVERSLLSLEGLGPRAGGGAIAEAFRRVHSIKGTAGYFGLTSIDELSHAMEAVLGQLRDGRVAGSRAVIDLLLEATDALRTAVGAAQRGEPSAVGDLVGRLNGAVGSSDPETVRLVEDGLADHLPPAVRCVDQAVVRRARANGERLLAVPSPGDDEGRERLVREVASLGTVVDLPPGTGFLRLLTVLELDLVASALGLAGGEVVELPLVAAAAAGEGSPAGPDCGASGAAQTGGGGSIRVPVSLLDELVNDAGELVLARNQLLSAVAARREGEGRLDVAAQHLSAVTTSLREKIMATRLQPLDSVLQRFPRMVRDLCSRLDREVDLVVEGGAVTLDKRVLETVADPLVHLVRNAVDHGIESPSDRVARGKPRVGRLSIRARHAGEFVHVEVSDDGRGINHRAVISRAVERGLVTHEEAARLQPGDVMRLVFAAGLSTRDSVSSISGRGVGLDAVKSHIERLGGGIEVRSEKGLGSTFVLRLPVSLAIVPAVVATVGRVALAFLQKQVYKVERIDGDRVGDRLVKVDGQPSLRVGDDYVPLVRLRSLLGLEELVELGPGKLAIEDRRRSVIDRRCPEVLAAVDGGADSERRSGVERRSGRGSILVVVVVEHYGNRVGMVVDEVLDIEELVVKPLPRHLATSRLFAGTTILGSGAVAVVADPDGIVRSARLAFPSLETTRRGEVRCGEEQAGLHSSVLLFDTPTGLVCGLPLADIASVDRFEAAEVQEAGSGPVVVRGDRPVRLVRIDDWLEGRPRGGALPDRGYLLVPTCPDCDWALVLAGIREARDVGEGAVVGGGVGFLRWTMVVDGTVVVVPDLKALAARLGPSASIEGGRA